MRADYNLFNDNLISKTNAYFFYPEYMRNRIFRAQKDFINSALKPPSKYKQSQSNLNRQYGSVRRLQDLDWLDPYNGFISSELTGGFLRGFPLINSMHFKNAL